MKNESLTIDPEALAYWYFRLNGCLTIPNFVVHPDYGIGQRTDVDILAIRFPYRAELLENSMIDDEVLSNITEKPMIIIAEVKTGKCKLNGPWVKLKDQNIHRVLRAIGAFPEEEVADVAGSIYEKGIYENNNYYITLCCVGKAMNRTIARQFPDVPQLLWGDILSFIFYRFNAYREQKRFHSQWDEVGQNIWNCFAISKDVTEFTQTVSVKVD